MTSRKTCDKCLHYKSSAIDHRPNAGECALMGDANDDRDGPGEDRVVGWDYEGYVAGCYVGPKFGCIHWEKQP